MSNDNATLQAPGVQELAGGPVNSAHSLFDTIGPGTQRPKTEHDPFPPETDQRSEWIGRHLDRYKIVRKLGGGGMGEVYLARHRWLDIPVAVKVLQPMLGGNELAIDRFRREARMVAGLNHPNIVRAIDGGPIENSYYLATEYLEGLDLDNLVTNNGPFPPEYAAWIVLEVASALHYAHERNLVHRDIKPHNIMLLRDGSVKLLDLGLARYLDSKSMMTATGQFMGTVDFVSPEQALDTRGVDLRTDIYSLGCTLYYLVTGRVPFGGAAYDSIASKILAHTEETPVPASDYCPSIPKSLVQTIDRMMEKSPDDRFQSAERSDRSIDSDSDPERRATRKSQSPKVRGPHLWPRRLRAMNPNWTRSQTLYFKSSGWCFARYCRFAKSWSESKSIPTHASVARRNTSGRSRPKVWQPSLQLRSSCFGSLPAW